VAFGVVNTTPGATSSAAWPTQAPTGCKPGRLWNLGGTGRHTLTAAPVRAASEELGPASSASLSGRTARGAGVPTVKENRVEAEPRTRTADVTVTRSPGKKGVAGRNVAPEPTLLRISLP
jgi:hypothetical protein